jgi:hypothetical protein
MNAEVIRRLTSRVAATIGEMNYAQRRMTELRFSLDRYMIEPNRAPDTYQEFLARTAGLPLQCEPAAWER